MSVMSHARIFEVMDCKQDLQHRIAAASQMSVSSKSLETLKMLSEDLRAYSLSNRKIAAAVRQKAAEQRRAATLRSAKEPAE